jgi:hypothetical protein
LITRSPLRFCIAFGPFETPKVERSVSNRGPQARRPVRSHCVGRSPFAQKCLWTKTRVSSHKRAGSHKSSGYWVPCTPARVRIDVNIGSVSPANTQMAQRQTRSTDYHVVVCMHSIAAFAFFVDIATYIHTLAVVSHAHHVARPVFRSVHPCDRLA